MDPKSFGRVSGAVLLGLWGDHVEGAGGAGADLFEIGGAARFASGRAASQWGRFAVGVPRKWELLTESQERPGPTSCEATSPSARSARPTSPPECPTSPPGLAFHSHRNAATAMSVGNTAPMKSRHGCTA